MTQTLPGRSLDEARRVAAGVDAELGLLLADLEAWVNVDTPSGAVEALDRLAATIAHTLEGYGLHAELVPVPDRALYLHASLEGAGTARVALLCHHDTVFPAGTAATWPFSRSDDRCHGPGVADMKGASRSPPMPRGCSQPARARSDGSSSSRPRTRRRVRPHR